MTTEVETRPYSDATKPGRIDSWGEEWWACDPYPTWFRWEGKKLVTPSRRLIFPDAIATRSKNTARVREAAEFLETLEPSKVQAQFIHQLYSALNDAERCVHSDGLGCGYKEDKHPLGPYGGHEFLQPRLSTYAVNLADAILDGELVFKQ